MFGGVSNGNPSFPVFMEENHFQYDMSTLPQLQLFGEFPVGCNIDPINYMANEHPSATSRPAMKRPREPESISRQQKLHFSLNSNLCPDETAQNGNILNRNPVSTGLRLSYEEDERNSTVTSASENIKATIPPTLSLANSFRIELDRQKEEFDHYITLQEKNIMKGVRELSQRHTATFLNTLEQGVNKKLQEKAMEIDNMNRKNKELGEKIKQVSVEAQNWHYRAKCNDYWVKK
jgi:E3 ubiquitin-protein ligase BOI-like protein